MLLLQPDERVRARRPIVWKDETWLHIRPQWDKPWHFHEPWVIFGGYYNDKLLELIEPKGPVTWVRAQAEHLYAAARFQKPTPRDTPPDWMILGLKLTHRLPEWEKDFRVYHLTDVRGGWVKIELESTSEHKFFKIMRVSEVRSKFTPHLNRFQRELDL